MKVIVDVDNLDAQTLKNGLIDLADQVLTRIPGELLEGEGSAHFRLYGGWDRNRKATRRAQDYSAELRGKFPFVFKKEKPISVTMELALATEAYPLRTLVNTLRSEGLSSGINFQQPTRVACRNHECPIEPLFPFFRDKKCPHPPCQTSPNSIASQNFQKMVDTMMVADIIHNAFRGNKKLCVVSSDDDLWPGILTALECGAHIIHMQPRFNGAASTLYLPQGSISYTGLGL